ncbi:tyrosine-type recombinase/integrase [Desulfoferrobacter suflitae]|uniref:tyrosine-type recombinase/integrase n=1 Tax=Desulfoferrobacter suflitae TaxID=2865782 RepID=UPI002164A73D|nr:site-specific integrase [Desulfoferrobacter suflitae]MCK8600155.1 site-specific integrase [Desulfoferrobacter suflitae]
MSKEDVYPVIQGTTGPIWKIAKGVRVRKSVDGTFEVEVPETKNGKTIRRRRRVQTLDRAINAAELFALKSKLELYRKGEDKEPQKMYTFENAAERWFEINEHNWSDSTQERYRGLLRQHIYPVIGGMPIIDTPHAEWREKIKIMLVEFRKIQSPKSAEVMHAVVSGVFTEEIDSGRIPSRMNPAHGLLKRVLPPKKRRNISKPDPFAPEDRDSVVEAAWKECRKDVAMVVEALAFSGMRLGEGLAMHIEKLDIKNCQYDVSEKVRHGKYGPPKSGEERLIDLPESLIIKLQAHIRRLKEKMFAEGKPVGYLFPGLTEGIVQRSLKRACLAARVRSRTPHDLRHTYAVTLIMAGESPEYVRKQLGHSSISITVDTYGKWMPNVKNRNLDESLRTKERS